MKKQSKSIIAILLATMMTMSLASCAPKGGDSSSSGADESKSEDAVVSADEPAYLKNKDKPVTLSWYSNYSWFNSAWEGYAAEQMTKDTGVTVEYIVPAGNEKEKLQTLIASGELPDLLTMYWAEPEIGDMVDAKMVEPLNKLADEFDPYFHKVAKEESLNWFRHEDGNNYVHPDNSYTKEDYEQIKTLTTNQTLLVREDIYKAIGSPDMSTQEGFLKALADAKEKYPSVDGQSLIPFGAHEFNDTGCYTFDGYIKNYLAVPFEKDGKWYDRDADPEYISWMKTFRKANEMGLISKDIFVDKRAQMEEKIAQGRYFAMMYQWSDCQGQNEQRWNADKSSTYIAVDGPKNSKGDPHMLDGPGTVGWNSTMISSNSKNKDRAIQFLTYRLTDRGQQVNWIGVEGETFEMVDGKPVMNQELQDLRLSDGEKFNKEYGLQATTQWLGFDGTIAERKGYALPLPEQKANILDWAQPYITNLSIYANPVVLPDTPESITKTKVDAEKGKLLPKVIMAKDDAEVDKLFAEYEKFKADNNWQAYLDLCQTTMDDAKEKLK